MVSGGTAESYRKGRDAAAGREGVRACVSSTGEGRNVAADLLSISGDTRLADMSLHEEVFGPFGIVVRARGDGQMEEIAEELEGQLTVTLQLDADDHALGQRLIPVLEHNAGWILANGFSTGVEVSPAMMHGGPYPATTMPGTPSVGTLAIRRSLRPICYRNLRGNAPPHGRKGLRRGERRASVRGLREGITLRRIGDA